MRRAQKDKRFFSIASVWWRGYQYRRIDPGWVAGGG